MDIKEKNQKQFEQAIAFFCGPGAMARKLSVSESSIRRWKIEGAPGYICAAIERQSNGKIKADVLRADLRFYRDQDGIHWTMRSAIVGGGE